MIITFIHSHGIMKLIFLLDNTTFDFVHKNSLKIGTLFRKMKLKMTYNTVIHKNKKQI